MLLTPTVLARSIGNSLGVAISSAVYQNILERKLWERLGNEVGAAKEISRIRNDLEELHHLPDAWYGRVVDSFMDAFRGVWLTTVCAAMLGFVCVSLLRQHKLHSTLERNT